MKIDTFKKRDETESNKIKPEVEKANKSRSLTNALVHLCSSIKIFQKSFAAAEINKLDEEDQLMAINEKLNEIKALVEDFDAITARTIPFHLMG